MIILCYDEIAWSWYYSYHAMLHHMTYDHNSYYLFCVIIYQTLLHAASMTSRQVLREMVLCVNDSFCETTLHSAGVQHCDEKKMLNIPY